ncbi:MAG: hypothetical protein QMD53_03545 [Actinomycetota bacterium]|nr:hypothetical protein [Actinomycetota bacterium]
MNKKRWLAISTATILVILIFGGLHLSAAPFLDFGKKNMPLPEEELDDDFEKGRAKFVSEGEDETDSYSSEVILDVAYGAADEEFGFREFPGGNELAGSIRAPSGIALGEDGVIFVADRASGEYGLVKETDPIAMTPAIKVFSESGEFIKKIEVDHDLRWTGEFGVDDENNLFILTQTRVYKMQVDLKEEDDDDEKAKTGFKPIGPKFKPIGPKLEEADELRVFPSGNYNVIDKTPTPEYNLRGRKFNKNGKFLKKPGEQHDYNFNLVEFEDREGDRVNFTLLGGGLEGAQYVVNRTGARGEEDELIYEPYLSPGFYYLGGGPSEFDNEGNLYYLRVNAPTIPLETEEDFEEYRRKIETWMDIIDLDEGNIVTLRLEDDKSISGLSRYHHAVDGDGNIFQLQADRDGVRVIKYSRD